MNFIDTDRHFFARRDILDVLHKRVLGLKEGYRQNVALLGSRTVGKTSILQRFMADHDDPSVIVVYLDLEDRDFAYFTTQFVKTILYQFLKSQNQPVHEDLKFLCAACRDTLKGTTVLVEAISALAKEGKYPEGYARLLSLPETFCAESGKSLVLIFDEFQDMADFSVPGVFQELGKRIMTQKNCLYIVASSYAEKARTILSEKLSLLFGNFETIPVSPFDLGSSLGLIDRHLSGVKMGLYLKNFLADFTGGRPLYINILCQELIALSGIYRQQEIYAPLLLQAVENLVFNPWGVLSRHFELQVQGLYRGAKSGGNLSSVLIAVAQGHHKISDLNRHLAVKPSQLAPRVAVLLEADIVEKNGNYYHVKDKLFKYWIKYVYERRLKAMDMEPGRARKMFKEEINRAVNDFQMTARKDLCARVVDLLHKFDDEAFELNGRRYKLSLFRDIKPVKLRLSAGNFFDALVAGTDEGQWLVVLKKDPLHENDVNGIMEEMKKMSPRPQRCVVVALSGLDDNAKLRALQEKFWVWNEPEVNALMHLYDEPCIVR